MELSLRADQEAHLLKLCKEMGRTPEDFVREAVLTFMEDYEDGREAEIAKAQSERTYTQEEMEREFGLDNRVLKPLPKTA